ncbi:hypothetical protein FQN50_009113 [Emmonsiellopsis sp. PD_5]|nr:hypothetical protein FQN50_009113 [Emmonsiellopsis sp. PD_5]
MTSNWDHSRFCPPSQTQLALALTIVKSKPANIPLKDHILQIRQHIHNGGNRHSNTTEDKHLDSITFWREAYEKSESAQSKLQDRIYELEQRNEALALRGEEKNSAGANLTTKRKSDGDLPTTASRSQKRSKTSKTGRSATSMPQMKDLLDGMPVELGFKENRTLLSLAIAICTRHTDITKATAPFLRHFHGLQKQLQKKTDPNALVSISVGFCEAADMSIRTALHSKANSSNRATTLQSLAPDIRHTLRGLTQSCPVILRALNKLFDHDRKCSGIGVITYHLVKFFQRALEHLHQYAVSKVKAKVAQEKGSNKKSKQRSRTKTTKTSTPNSTSNGTEEEEVTLKAFSHLIATMILSLNPVRPEENDLLEGFLYAVLDHVGKTLCLFVFKELHSNPALRSNSDKLPMPGNFNELNLCTDKMEIAQRAAGIEARHLIWILERVLAFTNQFETPPATPTSEDRGPAASNKSPPSILESVKVKLQNTLLKGIFGEGHEFNNTLKLPEMPSYSVADGDLSRWSYADAEKEPSEWFTQEVWRLIGWDVLLHHK